MPSSCANLVSPPAMAISRAVSAGVMAPDIKHDVYLPSNVPFNKTLNYLFSLPLMAEYREQDRPIDIALRRAKEVFGWNQVEFAKELSKFGRVVVPQDITNWKRRGMPPEHHQNVATLLRMSLDELVMPNAVGYGVAEKSPIGYASLTAEEQALVDSYRAASPEKRALFDALVNAGRPSGISPRVKRVLEDRAQLTRIESVLDDLDQRPKASIKRQKKRRA